MDSSAKPSSSRYERLTVCDEDEDSSTIIEQGFSYEDNTASLLEASDSLTSLTPSKSSLLPKFIFYLSFTLMLLSSVNIALFPTILSTYRAHPFSDSQLAALPFGDARLGLDRAAKLIPPPKVYYHAWPDKIVRVSRKLKDAVWGQGMQVYITVEDSTIMRFPVPPTGANTCAITWRPPPELSARAKDLTTKGDITEIEVWQLIAPSATATTSGSMHDLDYDTISFSALPVRGELLGVLDLTHKPNSTTHEFACPTGANESLVVELRCQRVACHVAFMQIHLAPIFGFELVRRKV